MERANLTLVLIPWMNSSTAEMSSYPFWFFLTDSLMIVGNTIAISVAFLFVFTTLRLDYPSYSISNLIACNTCLAIGLTSTVMLLNACYALKSDFRGSGYKDGSCVLRGNLLCIFSNYMYTSLCLKAFNRLRCIVYYTSPLFTSHRCLSMVIVFQWVLVILLSLPIIGTDGIDYDWRSHLCLVPITKTFQFLFTST